MASNHIANQATQIVAKDAELQAMRDGMSDLITYLTSSKFAEDRSVNVNDVILRVREIQAFAGDASNAAYANEEGPAPVASKHGWACPVCRAPLQDHEIWNDTDAKAANRMRLHWRELHKVAG